MARAGLFCRASWTWKIKKYFLPPSNMILSQLLENPLKCYQQWIVKIMLIKSSMFTLVFILLFVFPNVEYAQ